MSIYSVCYIYMLYSHIWIFHEQLGKCCCWTFWRLQYDFSAAHQTPLSQKMKENMIVDPRVSGSESEAHLSDVSVFSSADVLLPRDSGLVSLLPKQLLDSKIHINTPTSLQRVLKETAHPKTLKICSSSVHLRSGWVCFFIRNVSLHQCLSNGCSAVNGCRQNESLIKTSQ